MKTDEVIHEMVNNEKTKRDRFIRFTNFSRNLNEDDYYNIQFNYFRIHKQNLYCGVVVFFLIC